MNSYHCFCLLLSIFPLVAWSQWDKCPMLWLEEAITECCECWAPTKVPRNVETPKLSCVLAHHHHLILAPSSGGGWRSRSHWSSIIHQDLSSSTVTRWDSSHVSRLKTHLVLMSVIGTDWNKKIFNLLFKMRNQFLVKYFLNYAAMNLARMVQ